MIKIEFVPVFRVMAFHTLFTEIALVRVLFAMTVEATGGRFRELLIRFMARCAGYVFMAALKVKIRIIVIEGGAIQNGDIRVPANMVGMAYLAGCLCYFRAQTMKTLTCQEISVDLLVAVTAESGLCAFFEAYMTTGTFGLVLRVPLDKLAWHQQGFDISSVCCVHEKDAHGSKQA